MNTLQGILILLIAISTVIATPYGVEGILEDIGALDGNTLYVNADGSADYSSIQSAIDHASDGDMIYIYAGTYHEDLTVPLQLNIIGENVTTTTVQGNYAGGEDGILIASDNVTITNLTIAHGNKNGVLIDSVANITLRNCMISNSEKAGVRLIDAEHCMIVGNTIADSSYCGIILQGGNDTSLLSNVITSSTMHGIWIRGSNHCKADNNLIDGCTFSGISIEGMKYSNLSFNRILNCDDEGILSQLGYFNSIYANTILLSRHNGIEFRNSSSNDVEGNNLINNSIGISFTSCCIYDNAIYHNNFVENTQYEAFDSSGNTTWDDGPYHGGNYWSDYNGTDADLDGYGDQPYYISGSAGSIDRYPLMEQYVIYNDADNTPPDAPTIAGPWEGFAEQNYTFDFSSMDIDGHMIRVQISWGDGSNVSSSPLFLSGETFTVDHTWIDPGNYTVTAKAIDEREKESGYTSHYVEIYPALLPELAIADTRGGLMLSVDIINNGEASADSVDWRISTSNPFVFFGDKTGTVDRIDIGETVTIQSNPILGLGSSLFLIDVSIMGEEHLHTEQRTNVFFCFTFCLD